MKHTLHAPDVRYLIRTLNIASKGLALLDKAETAHRVAAVESEIEIVRDWLLRVSSVDVAVEPAAVETVTEKAT